MPKIVICMWTYTHTHTHRIISNNKSVNGANKVVNLPPIVLRLLHPEFLIEIHAMIFAQFIALILTLLYLYTSNTEMCNAKYNKNSFLEGISHKENLLP